MSDEDRSPKEMKSTPAVISLFILMVTGCATTSDLQNLGPEALLESAEIQMSQQNWILAQRRVLAAAEIYDKRGDKKGMADCHYASGKLARMAGKGTPDDFRRGIDQHSQAIDLYQQVSWFPGAAVAFAERAQLHFLLGEKEAACSDYREALKSFDAAKQKNPGFTIPVYNPRTSTFDGLVRIFMDEIGCGREEANQRVESTAVDARQYTGGSFSD